MRWKTMIGRSRDKFWEPESACVLVLNHCANAGILRIKRPLHSTESVGPNAVVAWASPECGMAAATHHSLTLPPCASVFDATAGLLFTWAQSILARVPSPS